MKNSTLKAATIALFSGLFIMGCEDNSAEDAGERIDEAEYTKHQHIAS